MSEVSKSLKTRVLISFLGTGNYQKVQYQLNGQSYESQLSIIPINNYFKPDKIYIIGTKDSRWEMVESLKHERIEIPAGKSADEFWQMFDLLSKNITVKESEIAFDITHCFRSIPFFVVVFIQFIKFLEKSTEVRHIFYGILDQKTNESHIIDLRPLMDLLDWMEALASFRKYGDLDDLCRLVERAEREIRQAGEKDSKLRLLKKDLMELTAVTKMTYIPQLGEISEALTQLMEDETLGSEIENYLKPLGILLSELKTMIQRFKKPTEWEAQLEVARWYLENKNPTQALLVLREAIISYKCLEMNLDLYDSKQRETTEKVLGQAVKNKSKEPLCVLWNQVSQARNKVAHALMRKREDIDPNRAIKKVFSLLEEASSIIKREAN
ncbi:MAG: TIGR02221 family CRISPR-associated protein [Candidatus Aminicenantes bacterium]|nr:TIGR02221 family CRISPR-associated protein [Candidatus Aminicenantes bacterium]